MAGKRVERAEAQWDLVVGLAREGGLVTAASSGASRAVSATVQCAPYWDANEERINPLSGGSRTLRRVAQDREP